MEAITIFEQDFPLQTQDSAGLVKVCILFVCVPIRVPHFLRHYPEGPNGQTYLQNRMGTDFQAWLVDGQLLPHAGSFESHHEQFQHWPSG